MEICAVLPDEEILGRVLRDDQREQRSPLDLLDETWIETGFARETEDLLSERVQEAAADGARPSVLQSRTDSFERDQIEAALARANGVKTRAAEELGITYRGLLKKMKRLGM